MSQNLELYRGLRDESLWTPQIVYDVPPPNTLVRESYDYGEGADGYNQEATRGSLLSGVADFFSKLLGGIGSVIGGAIEAGVGLLSHVVSGVTKLISGIANGIRGIFGGTTTDWEEDPNHVFAPVTESLEEAVLPILEKAEEGIERAGEANQKIIDLGVEFDAKVGEQGEITQRIEGINAEMARQFAEDGLLQEKFDAVRSDLSTATSGLSDDIDLLAQTVGEDIERLEKATEEDIDLLAQTIGEDYERLEKATSDLSDDIERLEKATEEDIDLLAQTTGEDIDLLAQTTGEAYQALNTQLWGDQGELNRINSELWGSQSTLNTTLSDFREMQLAWNDKTTGWVKKQEAIQALNTKLWGNQGELNRINNELWGSQSTLNTTLSDFREMQLEWNDNTTGWIKKQEEIQALNDEFREEQTRVTDEINGILAMLRAAQKKQIDTSFRTLTPYMNGGEDEYVRINPAGGVWAKGSWVGHIIYTTEPKQVSRKTGTGRGPDRHEHDYTDSRCETYSNTVPSQTGSRTYASTSTGISVVQYLPAPGTQQDEKLTRAAFTPGTSWTKLLGFKVNSPGDHIVNAEVNWAAADRGSKYGVEIGVMSAGGTWRRVRLWESNKLGPTFPWQDGKRTTSLLTSFDISDAEATSQAEIQLRAYSSGNSSQRHTSSSSMDITYIKQPTA